MTEKAVREGTPGKGRMASLLGLWKSRVCGCGHLSKGTKLGLLAIFVIALGLRLWPVSHGMPRNYVPDTHMVRSALGMAQDKTLVPEVDVYSSYPNLIPYMLLPVYGVQYGVGRATGKWSSADEFGRHVKQHPETVFLPARILVALIGSLGALVAFGAARAMGMRRGAWVAAWLTATSLMQLHFSIQERPWEPLVVFMLLSTWPAALYVVHEKRRYLIYSGLAAALSFSAHQAGAPALAIPGLAWLLVAVRSRGELKQKAAKLALDGVACVGLFAVLSLLVGHPYLWVHGATATEDMTAQGAELAAQGGAVSIGGQGFHFALRFESFARMSKALVGYAPVNLALGLIGILFAWRKRCMWPALGFLALWSFYFLNSSNDHVRYLLPIVALLPLPAALLAEKLFARGRVTSLALGVLLLVPLVQAVRMGYVLRQTDMRDAGESMVRALGEDTLVAIGPYGPIVELDLASLERLSTVRDLRGREGYRAEFLQSLAKSGHDADDPAIGPVGGAGVNAIRIEDLFEFHGRRRTFRVTPGLNLGGQDSDHWSVNQVLDFFGVTHIVLSDKIPGDGELSLLLTPETGYEEEDPTPAPLTGWHITNAIAPGCGELKFVTDTLDPADNSVDPAAYDARLPTEVDFALTAIWRVEQPGPALFLLERDKSLD